MNDLIRTVFCTATGCGVCGALSYSFGVGRPVSSGGVFVIPAMSKPLLDVVSLLGGVLVTGVLLLLLKRRRGETDDEEQKEEEEVDFGAISFS